MPRPPSAAALSEWRTRLEDFEGQWSFAQDTLEVVEDPQTLANGYIGDTATADGTPYRLVTTPVQFGGTPAPPKRSARPVPRPQTLSISGQNIDA